MADDVWFEWHRDEAVTVLMTIYRRSGTPLEEILGDLETSRNRFYRFIDVFKERGYLETFDTPRADHRVTPRGKRWLLMQRPREFLGVKSGLVVAGDESWE